MIFHSFHRCFGPLNTVKLHKSERERIEGGLGTLNAKVNWQLLHTETHPSPHVLTGWLLRKKRGEKVCDTPGLPV